MRIVTWSGRRVHGASPEIEIGASPDTSPERDSVEPLGTVLAWPNAPWCSAGAVARASLECPRTELGWASLALFGLALMPPREFP